MENEITNLPSVDIIPQQQIENLIYTIRDIQVMLDRDLARLYQVETKALNRAVKRNIERFPEHFMFQLTKEEWEDLKTQNKITNPLRYQTVTTNTEDGTLRYQTGTSNNGRGGTRYLPYVFTEQGVSQLSAVLRSQVAVSMSIRVIDAFVAMRRFLATNAGLFQRLEYVERHQLEADNKIEAILQRMDEMSPPPVTEQVFNNGCVFDAWQFVSDLVRTARERVILIDNYVDEKILTLLDKRQAGVICTIHSRYTEQFKEDLARHNEQYPTISFVQLPQRKHDRWLIIDNTTWMLGTSVKDMGRYLCAIKQMELDPELLLQMVNSSQH